MRGRSDLEVATDFVAHVRGPAEPAEVDLLAAALEGARVDESAR
jgi:exonuclease SbcD